MENERVRVNVDQNRCMGHALCNAVAPDVYELSDDDGHCLPVDGDIVAGRENQAVDGADACPERAITISR
jgi:ferredoxin